MHNDKFLTKHISKDLSQDDICDIFPNKICDNCCKCLGLDKSDIRSIDIDEIATNKVESMMFQDELEDFLYKEENIDNKDTSTELEYDVETTNADADEEIYYIEDFEEIKKILENEEYFKLLAHEEFPGLITLKK
ncbi:hypothetical protein [Clostridium amazonitimonense]|uniref:hypothetical protein n=1 Tax=Clostridium amazonitimonense TaxID=1499689 RepID=UPI000509CC08|nr:hypothetical protein [Clostridium amazonitimonense]